MQMSNDELEVNGFQECEFGDFCDFCETEAIEGNLFFHRTSWESPGEGDYYCRECAIKKILDKNEFFDLFYEKGE